MFGDPQKLRRELIGQKLLVNGQRYTVDEITSRFVRVRDAHGHKYEVALADMLRQLQELLIQQ